LGKRIRKRNPKGNRKRGPHSPMCIKLRYFNTAPQQPSSLSTQKFGKYTTLWGGWEGQPTRVTHDIE